MYPRVGEMILAMPHREQWEARREPLEGNLHNLRSILDQPIPRVTTIPDMTRAAEVLFPSLTGLDAILALLQLAIEKMPDERGSVAENIYGLTEESRGKKVGNAANWRSPRTKRSSARKLTTKRSERTRSEI